MNLRSLDVLIAMDFNRCMALMVSNFVKKQNVSARSGNGFQGERICEVYYLLLLDKKKLSL